MEVFLSHYSSLLQVCHFTKQLTVGSCTGSVGPASHRRRGAHSRGAHRCRDSHHAADHHPANGKHKDRLRRGEADSPASAALRPGPRATSQSRLDVDVAAAGRRRRQLRCLHRLFRPLRAAGTSRLDAT